MGGRLHRLSLFQRLVVVGLVLSTILALLVVVLGQTATRSLEKRILQERLAGARIAAKSLDTFLQYSVNELQSAASVIGPAIEGVSDSKVRESLDMALLSRISSAYTSVALLDTQGMLLEGSPQGMYGSNSSLLNAVPSLDEALAGDTPYFTTAFRNPVDEQVYMAVTVPVYTEGNNEPQAYLLGIIDPLLEPFQGILTDATSVLHTGHADLLDSAGVVLASTEHPGLSAGDHPDFYKENRANPDPVIRTVPHAEEVGLAPGEDHVMAYVRLSTAPMALSIGGSKRETFAAVRDFQARIYWLMGIVFGLATVGGLIAARKLVRPIHDLSVAARNMAQGDLERQVVVREGGEIGDLAGDLDMMRTHLRTSMGQIQEMNQVLEQGIAERTEELEQRNRELVAAAAIAEKVTSFMHVDEVLGHTVESVAEATGQTSIVVFLVDDAGQMLTMKSGRGLTSPMTLLMTSIAMGECVCGQVALSGEPMVVGDISDSLQVTRAECAAAGICCVAAFPLKSWERTEGVLTIFSPKPDSLTQQDFRVVNMICGQVGIAIQNARMYEEVAETEKLTHQLLGKVIDAQEDERKRLARELHEIQPKP